MGSVAMSMSISARAVLMQVRKLMPFGASASLATQTVVAPQKCCEHSTSANPSTTTENGTKDCRNITKMLRKMSSPKKIVELFEQHGDGEDLRKNRDAYRIAGTKLISAKAFDALEQILEQLLEKSKPSSPASEGLFMRAMMLYGRASMPDHIIRTFHKLKSLGIAVSPKSFNAFVSALVDSGNPQKASDFIKNAADFNVSPNLTTCNIAIHALCDMADYASALRLLEEMKAKRCEPNAVSYDTILDSVYDFRRKKKIRDGRLNEILDKLCEICTSKAISDGIRIRRLCKDMKAREALSVWEDLQSKGLSSRLDSHALNTLVLALCKERNPSEAKRVFSEMLRAKVSPSKDCFNFLVRSLVTSGDLDTALSVCRTMFRKNWVPDPSTLNILIDSLADSEKFESKDVRSLIKRMRKQQPPKLMSNSRTETASEERESKMQISVTD
eukprot:TRINITY_DN1241_c0_g1_i1.p1 TRINITY_DN1241_c0_g1~~TRINITY_DN1241_c0_g1_i1.p1  ORF type:complete len:444 (+),score=24.02 TRINITY_DN1241_c0_g1_i1:114-1445(+)